MRYRFRQNYKKYTGNKNVTKCYIGYVHGTTCAEYYDHIKVRLSIELPPNQLPTTSSSIGLNFWIFFLATVGTEGSGDFVPKRRLGAKPWCRSRAKLQKLSQIYTMIGKTKPPNFWQQLCQILTNFKNSFTDILSRKFAMQSYVGIPPHLTYVATLPCET